MGEREAATDGDQTMADHLAYVGVRKADDAACLRAFDDLVSRFGHDEASRAWRRACQEADAEEPSPAASQTEPPGG